MKYTVTFRLDEEECCCTDVTHIEADNIVEAAIEADKQLSSRCTIVRIEREI